MPARTRKLLPPDDADAIEQAVERYVEPLWEQWHAQYGVHGAAVERDADGWILTLEVMPGTIAANAATLIPAHIDLQLGASVTPTQIRTRVIVRQPPQKQTGHKKRLVLAGGTPGAGDTALGKGSAGTLGGWAWDTVDDSLVLLSCEHVFGAVNDIVFCTGVTPRVRIGKVKRSIAHSKALPLDCAIASIDAAHDPDFEVESLGPAIMMTGGRPRVGLPARKRAAETNLRLGSVLHSSRAVTLPVTDGSERYPRVIEIKGNPNDWSATGDSGALVFDDEEFESGLRAVIGLHFAGNVDADKNGFALPINEVFAALQLTTLPQGLLTALLRAATDTNDEALAARDAFVELYFSIEPTPHGKALLAVIENPDYLLKLTLDREGREPIIALLRRLLERGTTPGNILDHVITLEDATLLGQPLARLNETTEAVVSTLVERTTAAVGSTLRRSLIEDQNH